MNAVETKSEVEGFHEPRFSKAVDLEGQIARLPPRASCKGMFFNDLLERVKQHAPDHDVFAVAGIEKKSFLPVLSYPYADFMRLAYAAAGIVYPKEPRGTGLRRLGQHAFDVTFESMIGKAVFSALGWNLDKIVGHAPKAYFVAVGFGTVVSERKSAERYLLHFQSMPAFLETFQVGVVEGAIRHCDAEPRVRIAMKDLSNATLDVTWSR